VSCVCGSGKAAESCCQEIIKGQRAAATAEELMRARYAAYVHGDVDFLIESTLPEGRGDIDRDTTAVWSQQSTWLGFELLSKEKGEAGDEEGTIDFSARYKLKGMAVTHREHSTFKKVDGKWYFAEGTELTAPPIRNDNQVGRNEPCTCGSGKKYKKCCGK
jgi:SEC-C motif-containing protein